MPTNILKNQRGFTLIEMSIVLVIIGLIVGGILKGQELIESARQKNMASLYDQVKASQNTFLDRYRALPGDYTRSETAINENVANGDGNGYVSGDGEGPAADIAAIAGVAGNEGEFLNYFNGIVASGLFGGGQVTDGTAAPANFSGGADQSPLPSAPWTNTGLTVTSGIHEGEGTNDSTVEGVWLRLHVWTDDGDVTADNLPLTSAQGFQMDQKFDDGLPLTGRIRTLELGACADGNLYDVANATNVRECELVFLNN